MRSEALVPFAQITQKKTIKDKKKKQIFYCISFTPFTSFIKAVVAKRPLHLGGGEGDAVVPIKLNGYRRSIAGSPTSSKSQGLQEKMASIDTAALLKTISALENQLTALKGQLGGDLGSAVKPAKKKRAVNPDAKPNPWIEFLKRVQPIVKESKVEGPATIGVLFAKSLKANQENAYEMEAGAIADAFVAWATPENIEHAKSLKKAKKSKEDGASDSGSVADKSGADASAADSDDGAKEAPPEKPKRVLSDEQKAKMKAGREAAKAKKAAAAEGEAVAAEGEAVAAESAPTEKPEAPKKMEPKKVTKKAATYTKEQLSDWNTLTFEDEEFGINVRRGVNVRGDVINSDGDYVGHWDGKALDRSAAKPADWDTFA